MPTTTEWASSISALRNDIPRRFCAPWKSMTFALHLVFGLVGGGGLGIWYTLHLQRSTGTDWQAISIALFTVFPGIAATTLLELQSEKERYWQSFGLFLIIPFALLFYFSATEPCPVISFIIALVGLLLAIAMWCVAVGEKTVYDDVNKDASTPPPSMPMQGSEDGWTTSHSNPV